MQSASCKSHGGEGGEGGLNGGLLREEDVERAQQMAEAAKWARLRSSLEATSEKEESAAAKRKRGERKNTMHLGEFQQSFPP